MINYGIIDRASAFYESRGYARIEAPWLVSEAISNITKPDFAAQYFVTKNEKKKTFVASGEQSFLYLAAKGQLHPGKYQTITPCIRNDDFDETHVKYFMKLELIEWDTYNILLAPDKVVSRVTNDAYDFLKEAVQDEGVDDNLLTKVAMFGAYPTSYDIEYDDIELGSYGHRACGLGQWVYGTGIAEPRFSRVMKMKKGY